MTLETNSDPNKFWKDLLNEHLGLIAIISSFFFFSIRLLVISRGRNETAIFLLVHSDKVPLLLGTVLPFLPGASVFISTILFFNWLRRRNLLNEREEKLLLASALFLFGVGILVGRWTDWVIWGSSAFIFSEMPLIIKSRTKLNPLNFRLKIKTRSFRLPLFRLTSTSVVLMILFILSSTKSSLTSECVLLSNGTQLKASVLSTDTKYTYLVKLPEYRPIVLESSQIAIRAVEVGGKAMECKTDIKIFGRKLSGAPHVVPTLMLTL